VLGSRYGAIVPRQRAGTNDSVAVSSALLLALGCGSDITRADAAFSAWSAAPPVIDGAIQETGAVAVDGVIVVVGGFDAELRVTDQVRLFDTAANVWAFGPPLPVPLHHANVGAVEGSVFVLGALEGQSFTATGRTFRWTPGGAAAWTELAPMPAGTERGSAVVAAHDGLLYVAGGLRGGAVSDVATYDPHTDTWNTALPPLPAPRDHACGGVLADHIVVAGGREDVVTSISTATYRLSPGGAWTLAAPMPTARGGAACGVIGDHLVVAGGEGNRDATSGVFAAVELYDAAADAWRPLEPMRTPRHGMSAAAWTDRLYVPGGATVDGFGAVDVHEVLTIH
jgi:N-acetylneuraminic acid mutarotase